jgi:hypothetical protein
VALDALAEVVLRTIGNAFVEIVFVGVFYWPGWLMLKALTMGRYPPKKPHPHSDEFVGVFGFVAILVCTLAALLGGGI